MERPWDSQSHGRSWVPIHVLASISSFRKWDSQSPPYTESVMIVTVGQCLVPHLGGYHPSPSAHPGPHISLRTQPGWEDAWEARAACSALGHRSLVPGGESWLCLHHVIHLFSGHHLELGTGTCELQQQLVHLIATAQTHGEFRKEKKRCSSLSEGKKKEGARPHFYRVHQHVGLAADLFHFIVYFAEDCLIPACAHQRFAEFKSQAWKMSTVYIRGGQAVAWIIILCALKFPKLLAYVLK